MPDYRKIVPPVLGEEGLKHYDKVVDRKIAEQAAETESKITGQIGNASQGLENKITALTQTVESNKTDADNKISDLTTTVNNNKTSLDAKIEEAVTDLTTRIDGLPTTTDLANAISMALTSVYKYKGSVATEADLPTNLTSAEAGWVYDIQETGMNVAWTGEGWDPLGQEMFQISKITPEQIEAIFNGTTVDDDDSFVTTNAYQSLYNKVIASINSEVADVVEQFTEADNAIKESLPDQYLKLDGSNSLGSILNLNLLTQLYATVEGYNTDTENYNQNIITARTVDLHGNELELAPIKVGDPNKNIFDDTEIKSFAATRGFVQDHVAQKIAELNAIPDDYLFIDLYDITPNAAGYIGARFHCKGMIVSPSLKGTATVIDVETALNTRYSGDVSVEFDNLTGNYLDLKNNKAVILVDLEDGTVKTPHYSPDSGSGGIDFTTDDTLNLSDTNVLSVTNPVQPTVLTQAQYDALTDAQKSKGLYFINTPTAGEAEVFDNEYLRLDGKNAMKYGYIKLITSSKVYAFVVAKWLSTNYTPNKDVVSAHICKTNPDTGNLTNDLIPMMAADPDEEDLKVLSNGAGSFVATRGYVDSKVKESAGVGKNVKGESFPFPDSSLVGSSTSIAGIGAEVFNDYDTYSVNTETKKVASGNAAYGLYSHAEGSNNYARGSSSHVEGYNNICVGSYSHAEGSTNIAEGRSNHAGGEEVHTNGVCTFAHGQGITLKALGCAAFGTYPNEVSANAERDNNLFVVGNGTSPTYRANAFRVTSTGVYAKGNFNASGADYAEMFEWLDGNPNDEDRVGFFVTLDGEKIRIANSKDSYILGVVSADPSVIGDMYDDHWNGMYETDIFGRPVYEEVKDDTGDYLRLKVSQNYDPTKKYIGRKSRKEWAAIGMVGKLIVWDDGSCKVNSFCKCNDYGIATYSCEQTKFRVIARLDPNHIKIVMI